MDRRDHFLATRLAAFLERMSAALLGNGRPDASAPTHPMKWRPQRAPTPWGRSFRKALLVCSLGRSFSRKAALYSSKLRSPSASPFRGAVGLLRYQPFPHLSGKAKLLGFSDGFESDRSSRQLPCLRKSLGCPGSPIVTVQIVARQRCHFIVLTLHSKASTGRHVARGVRGPGL